MKYSIALLTLTFALKVSAGCPMTLSNESPAVPDGKVAGEVSMHTAETAAQTYVENIENFLDCSGLELSNRVYNELSNRVYNEWVDKALETADSYNVELQRYQQGQEALAKY